MTNKKHCRQMHSYLIRGRAAWHSLVCTWVGAGVRGAGRLPAARWGKGVSTVDGCCCWQADTKSRRHVPTVQAPDGAQDGAGRAPPPALVPSTTIAQVEFTPVVFTSVEEALHHHRGSS